MKFSILFSLVLMMCVPSLLRAQQTVRGTVIDQQTFVPLVGARVVLLNSDPPTGAVTDEQGAFRIPDVPLGRQHLQITYYGYETALATNLIVNSAQELVLSIGMEEKIFHTDEVEIVATPNKEGVQNELTSISARTFSVEEAQRYAGSRNDPARMAQNFAGVSGVNDQRNDLIIRGNSPTGVLWRMEGIDIPNPNHFGALGTTGGPVSMLNNNNLSDADFMTSAFPAEYGNALAGVFDLGLRNGNNQKHEFMGQIGFNGVELGAEGPFSQNSRASYLANYRYSLPALFGRLGQNTHAGVGSAVPVYQDLTFKVNIPTKSAGRLVLFGVGGNSEIRFEGEDAEEGGTNLFSGSEQNLYNRTASGVVGLSHTYLFNETTYGKLSIGTSLTQSAVELDTLTPGTGEAVRWYADQSRQIRYTAHYQLNKKFSARHHLRVGALYDLYDISLIDSVARAGGLYQRLRDFTGQSSLVQAYAQWKHRVSKQITFNGGLHSQYFLLNGSWALEPRLGLKVALAPQHRLSLGAGVHSQLQPLQVYFMETPQRGDPTKIERTNRDLGFTRSYQAVVGYDWSIASSLRLKAEAYYQHLWQVPVETRETAFSLLNVGAEFAPPSVDSLVNEGTGRNYGVELTVEKFFSQNYYFLVTGSLFESLYTGSDGIERGTAFNGNYILNTLVGKEFPLGQHSLSLDAKVTVAGGRRFTPIDVEASRLAGIAIYDVTNPYSEQFKPYFRADIKATFRLNLKGFAQEFSLDMQNITNHQNPFVETFNRGTGAIEISYQLGIFPVIQYRMLF
ncbi:MAG: TonB-dependent receptor [Bacteroidetes bacterium]|nr:MAG: TonB-dependent receptor [Bacteroidota bacterium]